MPNDNAPSPVKPTSQFAAYRIWWTAARPKTLCASICPVLIGTAIAAGARSAHWPSALAALIGAVAIQIGTNFSNDYFDYWQGADTSARKGPARAVQSGWVRPESMRRAFVVAFGIMGVACTFLVYRAGWPFALLGALSVVCGIGYTASRYSLAYLGLGDVFVLLFFGPVAVAGTYYAQALRFSLAAMVAGLGPGFLAVAILVVNNLRDIREDAAAHKRTLAVRLGPTFTRWEFAFCLLFAALTPVWLWAFLHFPARILISSLVILPGIIVTRRLWSRDGGALNPLLGQTGALLIIYSVTFSCLSAWR